MIYYTLSLKETSAIAKSNIIRFKTQYWACQVYKSKPTILDRFLQRTHIKHKTTPLGFPHEQCMECPLSIRNMIPI